MSDDVIGKFKDLYKSVHDIDLFIGASAEDPLPGAILGPTFACVIGVQFSKFKHGDRFWFENEGYEGEFTQGQVTEIRKASLARIFCNNLDNIRTIQPKVLLKPDEGFISSEEYVSFFIFKFLIY
ncbi:peroxidase-like [Anneissia japonica]|uniref:peroxidase-like n=1 Tax=Anneissia japonica TaxID=1529436 RepID=UPI0014258685|nr:peroxidase-like [Anneissia japonica]